MIKREQAEKVRILRLDSPPSNVLKIALLEALRREVLEAAEDQQVRCLVLASALPKYFSSGLDLAELTSLPPKRQDEPFKLLLEVYRALYQLSKPTIACIEGSAILGGWIVALAADFRIASPEARIALSEIRFGLSPTSLLIERMREISSSPTLIKEMVLRGKTLRAPEALAGGFVDEIAQGPCLEEALRQARNLAKLSPLAYASVKKSLQRRGASEELWKQSMAEFRELFSHESTREGIAAMRDKRRPRWEEI